MAAGVLDGHLFLPPLFGMAQPPKGLSGRIRKAPYANCREGRPQPALIVANPVDLHRTCSWCTDSGSQLVQPLRRRLDLRIAESSPRRWVQQAEVDAGRRAGLSSEERQELVELLPVNRVLDIETEILKRAGASFGQEHVLSPAFVLLHRGTLV